MLLSDIFGIEPIRGNWVDNYYQEIQLLYLDSGDDDKPTLVFYTVKREFYLCPLKELLAQEPDSFGR